MKHRFWIFSADHSGLPLAMRLQQEGHGVTLALIRPEEREGKFTPPKDAKQQKKNAEKTKYLLANGKGLIDKMWASEAMPRISRKDYVIFDQIYGWQFGDALRRRGCKVLGGCEVGYTLETERDGTLKLLKSLGMDLPAQQKFGKGSSQKAIQFLEKAQDKSLYVLKSDNTAVVTQVANESNDELIAKIEAESKEIDKEACLLQERVDGTEFAVETWYSNGVPVMANVDIEAKKKYNEMCEVQTGCSYDLLWTIPLDHPLRERVNKPFDKFAAKEIGTGLLDMSVIYEPKEDKYYALEVCGCRFAYNAFYSMLALLTVDVGDFLSSYLDGKYKGDVMERIFMQEPVYSCSIRVFNDDKTPDQMVSFPDDIKDDVWLWDVHKKGGAILTTGDEATGILTARGENPEGAMAELRKRFFQFSMPTKWARDDFDREEEPGHPLARFHRMERMKLI